jgi:hypothetical protein
VELGLALLHHASLPLNFWDHAFLIAAFLINRLPTELPILYQERSILKDLKSFWMFLFSFRQALQPV